MNSSESLSQSGNNQNQNILLVNLDDLKQIVRESISEEFANFSPKSEKKETPKYLSRKDVCELLGITYPTLHMLMNTGQLHYIKIGAKTLFQQKDLNLLIEQSAV